MSSAPFAVGSKALGICDRCGFEYLLKTLKDEVVDLNQTGLLVCEECFDRDQPQLQVGRWPVDDPQALRNPRPDTGTEGSRRIAIVDYSFVTSPDNPDGTEYFVSSSMTLASSSDGTMTAIGSTTERDPDIPRTDQVVGSRAVQSVDLSSLQETDYFDGTQFAYVRMKIRLTTAWVGTAAATGWLGKLYWNTVGNDAFDEAKSATVSEPGWVAGDGVYHILEWNLSSDSDWTGNIDKLKFLFNSNGVDWTTAGAYEIDYIRVEST